MSPWSDRILGEFPPDLARFWIAADPDDVLLDEHILSELRGRGFEVLPFEDAITFRADYEGRWRLAWDRAESGPAKALVLHLRSAEPGDLPWDYLRQARLVRLSLANLFPLLSYGVVHRLGAEYREALFDAHAKHASQSPDQIWGEAATKEFILTHIFQLGPHLISGNVDLWRELLRLHYRNTPLPTLLADHVETILAPKPAFEGLPISELFASQATFLRVVQQAWERFLEAKGILGSRIAEDRLPDSGWDSEGKIEIPFEHPDIRALIDSMFLDGTLHPLLVQKVPTDVSDWLAIGIVRDPAARRNLVFDEGACFAWLPTLTAVSRQALFSGLKPREFADTITGTSAEPALWSRFWQDQCLRAAEVLYRKKIRRVDQLDELAEALSKPSLKVAGLVVDTIDEIVHGAVLGKRGIASQIDSWCTSGFVEQLFAGGRTAFVNKGDCASKEIHRRMTESYGERETAYRAANRVMQTQADWGSLERIDKGRRVARQPPMVVSHDGLTAWLIEAALRYTGKAMSVATLESSAVLYPFSLEQPLAFVASRSPTLDLRADGARSQIVALQ